MSLTEGNRALQLFTDRHDLTKLFAEFLNDELPREQILYFHGDGGNGKSLLLKFLRTKCCKRFKESCWQEIKGKSAQRVAEYVEKLAHDWEFKRVPAVVQDFGLKPMDDDQPKDAFYGLLMLRRKLANAATGLKYSLRFPLYDFACVWYLHQKNKSTEEIKRLFPLSEITGIIAPLIDVVSGIPVGSIAKAVFDFFGKDMGKQLAFYLQKRQLKEADVQEICNMDVDSELFFELPRFFAQDLNAAMAQEQAPPRLVLFFDTHEAFWGKQRHLQGEEFFQPDEWLRYFLKELDLSSGVVVVVAGREIPRWHQAIKWEIEQSLVHSELVHHFSPEDASTYLQQEGIGIAEAQLQQSLIDYASVDAKKQQIHPLLLGLCADVVEKAKERGVTLTAADFAIAPDNKQKARELLARLLRYVDERIAHAVYALSAARAFDRELYYKLGEALHFQATKPDFLILRRFSFVWESDKGKDWFRIHELIRKLDYDEDSRETKRQAHEFLEQYYREQGNIAEAIYHANRLDWERGVNEWVEVFDKALKQSRYQLCRSLQDIRNELIVESDFQLGNISRLEGDYFAELAQHGNAKQEYLEAIAAYNTALQLAPDDVNALNNKGIALQSLGDLQSQLSQHQDALLSYENAIASYNAALQLAPDHVSALSNKGIALARLGELQSQLSQHQDALLSYENAIAAYNAALQIASDDISALNNKGLALLSLGELQSQLSQHQDALLSYKNAIASCNATLQLAPDDVYALNNKGLALLSLGKLQSQLSQHQDALLSYENAIASCNAALQLAPDFVGSLNNKGIALQSLGELQSELSQHQDALQSYKNAIASFNAALQLAPDFVMSLNNKGIALLRLGELQSELSQHQDALQSYENAIAAYNAALQIAPDDVNALNNKGNALQSLGKLQSQLSQHQDALLSYENAIASYNAALQIAPDFVMSLNNKGNALQSLGKLQSQLSQHQDALLSYENAIASYNAALLLASDDISALNNKGNALLSLGKLQTQLSQNQDALQSYENAIAAFSAALQLAPDFVAALNNKGNALLSLGKLQTQLSQNQEALESYQGALVAFIKGRWRRLIARWRSRQ